jgi:beta-lactamase class A
LTPSTQIVRTYSRNSKGIQALINYWLSTRGAQFGINFKTIDGQIAASHNPDKQFTSASVYKLFLAYVIYSKVEAGEMSLSDSSYNGYTVQKCIEIMITISTNECAIALGNTVGWNANDPKLKAIGINDTTLTSNNHLTTARDTSTILTALHNGTILNAEHREQLLGLLRRQIHRYGIPAGSAGMTVADKVGYLGSFTHDVAIVYHPKGSYVLSILSTGGSFYPFADLARQINSVMNQ